MEQFFYPLHQSIGTPSVPVVEVGTEVRRGEKIAVAPEGKLGCPIYTSVPGRVASVTADAIMITAEDVPVSMTDVPFEKLAPAAPLDMVRASGLVGLGGAGFPAAVKYAKPLGPSGTVIMGLLRWALANLSFAIFSKLPGVLGQIFGPIPLLQVGIPAVFSIYFDVFSSLLQAFIFCMLMMMNISSAAED